MANNTTSDNCNRWENEGGAPAPTPADDSNFDNQLEQNVKDAILKRKNIVKIREIDWTDDDWYHGC
jgi:hypothetical protein